MVSPYLSAIIEQDEAPEMVKHFRGFFVGGYKVRAFLGRNLDVSQRLACLCPRCRCVINQASEYQISRMECEKQ